MRKTVIAAALALAGSAGAGAALAQSAPQAPSPDTETQSDAATQPGAQPRGPHEMRMGWWRHHLVQCWLTAALYRARRLL